ncbi:MAG: hypothetical protein R3C02_23245 [Planctomycetaceae bacterium]
MGWGDRGIDPVGVEVDAEVFERGCCEILRTDDAAFDRRAAVIAAADNLTGGRLPWRRPSTSCWSSGDVPPAR